MWIKRIIFKNHKVLGKMFNFFPSGYGRTRSKQNIESYIDIIFSKPKKGNIYTCIIGKNGSGKSVLLRSIIHSLNVLSDESIQNPALDYFSYHSKPEGIKQAWQKYKLEPQINAKNALLEFEIVDSDDNPKKRHNLTSFSDDIESNIQTAGEILESSPKLIDHISSELKHYLSDTFIIHVTNAKYDKPIRHPNPKFRSFAADETVSNSAYLMAKSIFVDNCREKIVKIIKKILNYSQQIAIKFEVFVSYGLNIENVFKLINELSEFEFIENQGSNFFKISDKIQNTIFFADMFLTSEDPYKVVELIKRSAVLKKLKDYFKGEVRSVNLNHFGSTFCFEITEEVVSNYADLCILGIFQQLDILTLRCVINDVPFDNLSSGEKEQIRLATYLSAGIFKKRANSNQLLLLIDEPENSLHPEWKYDYCANLENLLQWFGYRNAQVILTTHSPLLLMGLDRASVKYCALNATKKPKNSFNVVEDVNAFCSEEVLLDIFGVSYRKKDDFDAVKRVILGKGSKQDLKNYPGENDPLRSSLTFGKTQNKLQEIALEILKGRAS